MDKCLAFFPFKITHILTHNGLDPRAELEQAKQFTTRLLKSKSGNSCQKISKMDVKICREQYLTSPYNSFYPKNKQNGRTYKWDY